MQTDDFSGSSRLFTAAAKENTLCATVSVGRASAFGRSMVLSPTRARRCNNCCLIRAQTKDWLIQCQDNVTGSPGGLSYFISGT